MPQPLIATYGVWAAWVVSWGLASFWSSRAQKRPALGSEIFYRVAMGAGGVLMLIQTPRLHTYPLWHVPTAFGWVLAALTAAGFLFCWWARLYLGRLWSSAVTKKADHRIVDTGPYGLVRHPIYTGLIFASYALAIERGTAFALAGATLMTFGCYLKARLEEQFLRQELGRDAYDAYAARVAMLVPFARM